MFIYSFVFVILFQCYFYCLFFFQLEERERQFDEERSFKVCINFIN